MNTKKFAAVITAMMMGATVFAGCGQIDSSASVVTVGDDKISLGYANFVARYTQATYDQYLMGYYGQDMWTSDMSGQGVTLEEEVKGDILDALEEQYLCKTHASEYGVVITDEDNAAMDEAVASFMEANPAETLEEMGATEEYVKSMLEARTYLFKVQQAVKASAEVEVTDEECWQRSFSYAFFSTSTTYDSEGNAIEVTDEFITDQKAAAKQVAEAEDFDAAAEESGASVSTYSYTKGETDPSFNADVIEAAEKMSEGQVSGVIEVEGSGYYVIRLDKDHDEEASESQRALLISQKETEFYNETLDQWKEAINWKVDEKLWKQVKFDDLFQTIETEDTTAEE